MQGWCLVCQRIEEVMEPDLLTRRKPCVPIAEERRDNAATRLVRRIAEAT